MKVVAALLILAAVLPQSIAIPKNYEDVKAGRAWFEATPRKSPITDEVMTSFILKAAQDDPPDEVRGALYMTCSKNWKPDASLQAERYFADSREAVLFGGFSGPRARGRSLVQVQLRVDDAKSTKFWERNKSLTSLKIDDGTVKAIFTAKLVVILFDDDLERPHVARFKMADVDSSRVIEVCGLAPRN